MLFYSIIEIFMIKLHVFDIKFVDLLITELSYITWFLLIKSIEVLLFDSFKELLLLLLLISSLIMLLFIIFVRVLLLVFYSKYVLFFITLFKSLIIVNSLL